MSKCPKCGESISFWAKYSASGVCKACQLAKVAEKEAQEAQQRQEQAELRSKLIIEGKEIGCLICGHDSFAKQEVLMNTRGATFMNMEWMNAGAEACTCKRCGYVHWFRRAP